jgi:hypothetical protein
MSLSARITELLIRLRWPLLAVAGVIGALAVAAEIDVRTGRPLEKMFADGTRAQQVVHRLVQVFAGEVPFDRSIENMFADDDPLLPSYRKLKRTFGGDELVMTVYEDADLLTPAGMARLAAIDAQLAAIDGVAATLSLHSPMGDAMADRSNPLSQRFYELFTGYTHGAEGPSVAVLCMLQPESEATQSRSETIQAIRETIEQHPAGKIAGEPVMVSEGFSLVEEDGRRLGYTSTLLLILVIAICFRSIRWVVIPILVVQFTLVLTRAGIVLAGVRLSMVSSMLTAIVTVVGVATVIHIIVRFRDARADGLSQREALLLAGTVLATPILWSCLTDTVGFSSLLAAKVGPVKDFGMMCAAGALLVLVAVALLVPGLTLAGCFVSDPRRAWGEGRIDGALRRTLAWVERRPLIVGLLTLVLTSIAIAGCFRIRVETDFTKNFRAGSKIVVAYDYLEANMGGTGIWDVIVPAPEELNWAYLSKVLALEEELRKELPGLTKVMSIADGVTAASPVDLNNVRMELIRRGMIRTAQGVLNERMPAFAQALYGVDPTTGQHYLRIMLRAYERQSSADKRRLIGEVERISRKHFPEAETTGYFVLLASLIDSMLRDQWITFGIATAGIGLMMLVAFRSLPLALVALVPNALPIVMVTGLMGWLNLVWPEVKINMGAAMIAAVSIGLSVDSSIHYITAFRRNLGEGMTVDAALDGVQQSVGRALIFATLALIVGFSALLTSDFVPTIYFGALVSLSMLGGLAGNLIVLPLLLRAVTRKEA